MEVQTRSWQTFSVNILGSVGKIICFAATPLCPRTEKAVTENKETKGCGCVRTNLYL